MKQQRIKLLLKRQWMEKRTNIKSGVTLAETLISLVIIFLLLNVVQLTLTASQNYIKKLKEIHALEWWIGTHQIEKDIHNEQFLYCKTTSKKGIYFYDEKQRVMVYRPYKNQLIRSRYKDQRFYGYVPYIFSLNQFSFQEKAGQLYLEGIMDDGKKYQTILDVNKKR